MPESNENNAQVLDSLPKKSQGYNRTKSTMEKKRRKRSKSVNIEVQEAIMN